MAKKELSKLEEVLKELNKSYGEGSVITGNQQFTPSDTISTGSIGLDAALGVGGIPTGKIIELLGWESSGKSTILQTIIGNAQKKGIKCLYVDGENSLDDKYAKALGVNMEDLLVIQLDEHGGEAAYNKAEKLINTGEIGLVAFDSQNSLQPKKLLEGEVGDATMGVHARMLGQAVMKMNAAAIKTGCTVIFVSQLREKIGVMFGCLHADMPIIFTDGRTIPIKKVVENKIEGEVWSFNEETKNFESKKIIDWHYNGNVNNNSDYLHIETDGILSNKFGITVTPNHRLFSDNGWKKAEEINVGDNLLSKYESVFGGDGEKFIQGCLAGDSHISIRNKNTGSLKFQDSKNKEYVNWKKEILSVLKWNNYTKNRWDSENTYEFAKLKKEIGNRNPLNIFKDGKISDLSLAIWIMDDGHFKKSHKSYQLSVKRFKKNAEILDGIKNLFINSGLPCKYNLEDGNFNFDVFTSKIIAEKIEMYVPTCMEYKLPKFISKSDKVIPVVTKIVKSEYVRVLSKRIASDRQIRQKGKYDISVEGNHNYLSGGIHSGVVVHNSPETVQGGNALRFYSHVRIDFRKSLLKEGDVTYANKTKVKIIKNKCAVPYKTAEFEVVFGEGVNKLQEIIELGSELSILKKWGTQITYKEIKYTIEEFKLMLKENNEFYEEIRNEIIKNIKNGKTDI